MFYNTEMLTKRGPLARVWMASHLSTKLSKSNLLATSIPTSVTSILGEALLPMALRLSGQLLLGVTRIYSRKAKYLLDDCNDTLGKVKRAFRPGAVDMEEAEGGRNRDTINLRVEEGGIEDLLNNDAAMNYWDADFNAAPVASTSKGKNVMTNAQISLAEDHFATGDVEFGWGDDFDGDVDLNLFGDDPEMQEMMPGDDPKGKKRARLNSEDEEDLDVELGRDAAGSVGHASARRSSAFGEGEDAMDVDGDLTMNSGVKAFDLGEKEFDMGGMGQFDFPDNDNAEFFAGMDFGGGGPEDREKTPQANGNNDNDDDALELTPKTAADLVKVGKRGSAKKPRVRKQVVDRVTELEWENGSVAKAAQKENLFTEPKYLPKSRLHLRLLELAADPHSNANGMPQPVPGDDDWTFSAPPGLAPELSELFQFQTRESRVVRQQVAEEVDVEVEQGRRAASMDLGGMGQLDFPDNDNADFFAGMDFGGGGPDETNGSIKGFQFEVEEEEVGATKANKKKRSAASADLPASQRESPARHDYHDDIIHSTSAGPLAIFDDASGAGMYNTQTTQETQSYSGSMSQVRESLGETEEEAILANATQAAQDDKKWSKNTVKALGVLRNEFSNNDDEEIVFEKVANKASRRAAAAFFFELLVLSTRDCVKLDQSMAFGTIKVAATSKLWGDAEGSDE